MDASIAEILVGYRQGHINLETAEEAVRRAVLRHPFRSRTQETEHTITLPRHEELDELLRPRFDK